MGVCQLTNATNAVAMIIGGINAHLEEEREDNEEDEEDAMLDEETVSRHLVLWLSRG